MMFESLEEEIDDLKEAINKLIRLESLEKEINDIKEVVNKLKNLETLDVFELKGNYNHTLLKLKVIEEEFDKVKKRFEEFEDKLDKVNEKYKDQDAASQSRKSFFNMILDIVFRIVLMVAGGYILYKLGLQSPPN
jgi:chromosome segregation ATPase